MKNNRAAILLAAGQGSRMSPLTDNYPKCLLPVGELTVIDTLLPHLLQDSEREIVLVTGYQAEKVERYIRQRYPEKRITFAHNPHYATDINILSLALGVDALRAPERGYTVIETDILLEPAAWNVIKAAERGRESFWLTRGRYGQALTGGIVEACENGGSIGRIAYVPDYQSAFEGWFKMVGILSVAAEQVSADRALRKKALGDSCRQYYMAPWCQNRAALPCIAIDLANLYSCSFNTPDEYSAAVREYLENHSEIPHANPVL